MAMIDIPDRTARRQTRCTVCKSTSAVVVIRENGYEGRACACGTIYVTPEPRPDEIDRTFDGHPDAFYDLPAALKARWIRRRTSGDELLEIGCGKGSFLKAARAAGFHVEGIEAEPRRAAATARNHNAVVHAAFFEDFTPERRVDVVYHCDMLAHFDRPAEALRRMTTFLKPGGVLAFEVGLVGELPPFWYSWIGDVGYPQHRWLYSQRSLRRLLREAGLQIEHIKTFDLSACVAAHHALRTTVRLVRMLVPRKRTTPRAAGNKEHSDGGGAVLRLRNILRYRVGAWLPRIGPATALVIARPVEAIGDERIRVLD
jgi:SAM-dependent methyltransferase